MPKKIKKLLNLLAAGCWFSFLLSISLRMLAWRVAHEPSVTIQPSYQSWATIAFWFGLPGYILINLVFLIYKEKNWERIGLAYLVATLIYLPIFVISLVLMV